MKIFCPNFSSRWASELLHADTEGKQKPERTLHRDLLLPCGYLPAPAPYLPAKKKTPAFPPLDPADDYADDRINSVVQVPTALEPVRFTTVIDLPTVRPPALLLDPPEVTAPIPPQAPVSPDDGSSAVGGHMSSVAEEPPLAAGTVEPEESCEIDLDLPDSAEIPEPERDLPESPIPAEPLTERDLPDPAGTSITVESPLPQPEPSSTSELDSPLAADPSLEPEPPLRRSARSRQPPDRLQYSAPGQPFLKSIQSLLHGLSTAFTIALEDDSHVVPTVPSQSTIRCQPGPCPRPYMGSGGESVTQAM